MAKLVLLVLMALFVAATAFAQTEETITGDPGGTETTTEEPPLDDGIDDEIVFDPYTPAYNNVPLVIDAGAGSQAADIASSTEANGAKNGEITVRRTAAGLEVYSGLHRVEVIAANSDGWNGTLQDEGTLIRFQPSGRPELECPAQDVANWFGPCKIPTEESLQ